MSKLTLKMKDSIDLNLFCGDWEETTEEFIKKYPGGRYIAINKNTKKIDSSGCDHDLEFWILANIAYQI